MAKPVMRLRFTQGLAALQKVVNDLEVPGTWISLNENQWQFLASAGGVLNWYPSTGTVNFQGPSSGRNQLESRVLPALTSGSETPLTASPSIRQVDQQIAGAVFTEPSIPPNSDEGVQQSLESLYLQQKFSTSELVIGLVGAVGTELPPVVRNLEDRLKVYGYTPCYIRISKDIIPTLSASARSSHSAEFGRVNGLMDAGNDARRRSGSNSILAYGVADAIRRHRSKLGAGKKVAFIVSSLKRPEEVVALREIYRGGFYLIGVYADETRRIKYLVESKRIEEQRAIELIERDMDESDKNGQRTRDTFHLSDMFVRLEGNSDLLMHGLWRMLDILFGHPYMTPTFDEYAMFMAQSAALRSADLSRQVGAVIARDREIIATGANDVPTAGGGLYWPEYKDSRIVDSDSGRDYKRREDSNKAEQRKMIDDIVAQVGSLVADPNALRTILERSRIADITEYGRIVHAEMEAILSLARSNVSARDAWLFCTTFPCHNCAKHIVSAGLKRVVYIEPYPKSKAADLHSDSISFDFSAKEGFVQFEPFVGVGPRRFFDLFSMRLGSGYRLKRKDDEGQVVDWTPENAILRVQMIPRSYLELESEAAKIFSCYSDTVRVPGAGT